MIGLGVRLTRGRAAAVAAPPAPPADNTFYSTLNSASRLPPTTVALDWDGVGWQVNGGPTWVDGMSHSIQWSGKKKRVRFQLNNTENDKSSADSAGTRRIEFDPNATIPNGVERWMAFSVVPEAYTDAAGMNALGTAVTAVLTQIHYGAGGGNPAFAIRRKHNGDILVTTRGQGEPSSVERFTGALASYPMGLVEDWVVRFTLHATAGAVQVWRNGVELVNLTGIPLSEGDGTAYAKMGIYCSGGMAGQVAAQFANRVQPQAGSLASRVTSPPAWPQDLLENTSAPTVAARATSKLDTNGTSFTPTLAAHAAGDYLLVIVTVDGIATAPTTATSGWSRLLNTSEGSQVQQAIFYYGSGGVMAPAPSGSTPAPVISQSSEMDTAVALTVQAGSAPTIEATGAFATTTNANPPLTTLAGGERAALLIAAAGHDGILTTPSATPPGYSTLTAITGGVTGGTSTAVAEWRGKVASENPSPFISAVEQWAAHTIALSVAG